MTQSSLNSQGQLILSVLDYRKRGDNSMAIVSHNRKLTQGYGLNKSCLLLASFKDLLFFPTHLALMPWNSNLTKFNKEV